MNLLRRVIKRAAPDTYRKVERKMTMPIETRLEASSVPWLNFSGLVVGRNSDFHTDTLTTEQVEDIGGTEYRALRLLSYLVPAVRLFTEIFFCCNHAIHSPYFPNVVFCCLSSCCASAILAMAVFHQHI